MANLFTYPFHVQPDGSVAKTPDGENYYAQELVNLILTDPGERSLVPDYGIDDPVFNSLNIVELLGKIEMYGPPVNIDTDSGVTTTWVRDGVATVNVNYSVATSDDSDPISNNTTTTDDDYDDDSDTDPTINDFYGFNDRTD